jgi:hypothetical protein
VPVTAQAITKAVQDDNPFPEDDASSSQDDNVTELHRALFAKGTLDTSGMLTAKIAGALLMESGLTGIQLRTVWSTTKTKGAGTCPTHMMDFAEFKAACNLAVESGGAFTTESSA